MTTSFGAELLPVAASSLHTEVRIRAGSTREHRALTGIVMMRTEEAADFATMCEAWNDAYFPREEPT